jgi:fructosamine-3-kinase
MEYIQSSAPNSDYWSLLGRGLAKLHQQTNDQFGWSEPNYIGRLPQKNDWHADWNEFFWEQRLKPQIKTARDQGRLTTEQAKGLDALSGKLSQIFPPSRPALLHGDLWSGNVMVGATGEPVLVDPAVYFGHPEIELAFTKLFGGFDQQFYESYQEESALAPGFDQRIDLYNLYPLLVHLNLFGTGYLQEVLQTGKKYG